MTNLKNSLPKVAVIGGGIFGVTAAFFLGERATVDLYEQNTSLFSAASGINQYRAHRGYHYPRSDNTIESCKKGEQSFRSVYAGAMIDTNDHYYAISNQSSLTSGEVYLQTLAKHNLPFEEVRLDLLHQDAVDVTIKVKEAIIDPKKLVSIAKNGLKRAGVKVLLGTKATSDVFAAYDHVFICTYAYTNELLGAYPRAQREYQYELCEKIVVKLPQQYHTTSVVIMDGPFMCFDPYGATNTFLLGNVVHALHTSNIGPKPELDPQFKDVLHNGIIKHPPVTHFDKFIESGCKFFKEFEQAEYVGSMFTWRTVLPYKDVSDERPTLITKVSDKITTVYSGKLINAVDTGIELSRMIETI